ncbi:MULTISPECIES: ClpXP protease specificity-enhancing factor [Stutzerimonas stutzeri subgroup]|uniref:ClpXP protease specificity-enhancing factor n=2 Tax=Gammaproteobacteria TaxID=1236 RepID=A0A2N8REL0_STUST|nr:MULTISPECIES: ClpXP protease specificity-enhancing factor [Stutzerimonas stutzeri subgroup]KRW70666.1 peptidase [Pseudomonas sp. TTU2014-105ASC]MDH2243933.1 ClpXP protease specificity-enhancing factor [Pseudomonas sp. GD03909]MDH2245207.1 ClpXP protease specificity-enhancing factor [Pseudomonas sp. GD03856]MDH2264301.1 ClpXP protease specificity-enhancing factor [Pseudomonas sp. GD03855]EHY76680.1 ClpXP protease specificity-enhancing factor [Stutzerimonas stutzeri ATCC 14405 = CCUG 16156]
MNSSRPYLVRALYEWIVDNECTPHLLVNVDYPGVQVPAGFASDGQIVLNVAPSAVRHLHMDNEAISFEGRFGGVAHSLNVPSAAVMAIYARENGQGMVFEIEPSPPDDDAPSDNGGAGDEGPRPGGRPSLKVVK